MPDLTNCRPIRSTRADFPEIAQMVFRYARDHGLRGGQANIAFFILSPRMMRMVQVKEGVRRATEADPDVMMLSPNDVFGARNIRGGDPNPCVILCRNAGGGGLHSERRCGAVFEDHFPRARITYVFSEREPCHDNPASCTAYLGDLLYRSGADRVNTPVRYYAQWQSAAEAATAHALGLQVKRSAEAQKDVKQLRKRAKF